MDRIQYLAELSVGRACGFGTLAIITTMCGMAGDLELCLKTGAGLTVLMGLVLGWRAWRARRRDPRKTEVYLMLDKGRDLPSGHPLSQINEALHAIYLRYAEYAGMLALCLIVLAVALPAVLGSSIRMADR
jgi:hypothetical protein